MRKCVQNIESAIYAKVAEIKAVEKYLPVVVIIHDIRDWSVVHISERGLQELNVTLHELQRMGTDYHKKYFNPEEAKEYVPGILGLIERNNNDEAISYFQQVKLAETREWKWHMSASKILMRNNEGKPLLVITTSMPIDPQHTFTAKIQRLLDENNFLRNNTARFLTLTKKEKAVLRLMAGGMSAKEIGSVLKMSEATATTHRRNIKSKLELQNNYQIIRFAQSFNLI